MVRIEKLHIVNFKGIDDLARRIENYLLEMLEHSAYLLRPWPEVRDRIAESLQSRVFLDACNLVIAEVRKDTRRSWIKFFPDSESISSREEVAQRSRLNLTRGSMP